MNVRRSSQELAKLASVDLALLLSKMRAQKDDGALHNLHGLRWLFNISASAEKLNGGVLGDTPSRDATELARACWRSIPRASLSEVRDFTRSLRPSPAFTRVLVPSVSDDDQPERSWHSAIRRRAITLCSSYIRKSIQQKSRDASEARRIAEAAWTLRHLTSPETVQKLVWTEMGPRPDIESVIWWLGCLVPSNRLLSPPGGWVLANLQPTVIDILCGREALSEAAPHLGVPDDQEESIGENSDTWQHRERRARAGLSAFLAEV